MDYQITDWKKEFLTIYENKIHREGADKLLNYLNRSDFFDAPASTKFHSNYSGGLCEHSVKVYYRFRQKLLSENLDNAFAKSPDIEESIAIVALLHDVCKVNFYKTEKRNVKNEDGEWIKKDYFAIDEKFPYGHGEKSVYIINEYLHLTTEEAICINWHMGGFDKRVVGGDNSMGAAFLLYPTAVLFHTSDTESTYLDEKITK